MAPLVVALGEAMLRLSPPAHGRLEEARALDVHVAGSELNVAVALASLGVPSRWMSALPDTPLGRRVVFDARAAGVDTTYVQRVEARMGLFFVEFGVEPRATSVWYDREQSAFRAMREVNAAALDGATYAVVSGVTAALGPEGRAITAQFATLALDAGAALCIDVNYRSRLWSGDDAREALAPVIARAQVVVCSRADAAEVFGITGDDPLDVLDQLRNQYASAADAVVLTLGASGAVAVEGDAAPVAQDAYPSGSMDRIGAGDAFVAGLLWGLSQSVPLRDSLARGAALAALKRTVPGDFARFTADEVLEVVADPQRALVR
jgi:2-dehydro-3-deoxygluconokinase